MKTIPSLFLVAAAWISLLAANLHAATRYVWPYSPSPSAPFDQWANAAHDIQTAVNAAVPGETVLVTNGVYATGGAITPGYALSNRVVVTKPITLLSVNGPAETVIQGLGPVGNLASRCVYLTNGAALLGFTITGGATLTNGDTTYDRRGAGVFLDRGGAVSNCVIASNTAYNMGGGVYANQGGNIFSTVVRSNQSVSAGGGGLYCLAETPPQSIVRDCVIAGNSAEYGGGLRFYASGLAANCTIADNQARNGGGGGVHLVYGGSVSNCTILSNTATTVGGGLYSLRDGGLVTYCEIRGNSAVYGGGAQFDFANTIARCTIVSNTAQYGGGLRFWTNGLAVNCTFVGNQATYEGGGIHLACGGSTINGCQIWSNSVTAGHGGGVAGASVPRFANSLLTGCDLVGNTSGNDGGGAVFLSPMSAGTGTLRNCQVIGNRAGGDGGGTRNAIVRSSLFQDNQAHNGGGMDDGEAYSSTFKGNVANNYGGGSFSSVAVSSLFVSNTAAQYGGGAAGDYGETSVLTNCTVRGNSVSGLGQRYGGVWRTKIFNCIVWNNSSGDTDNSGGALFSCAPDLTAGYYGCITNAPLFANPAVGDYTLIQFSPCINTGTNFDWMTNTTDLKGNPRILGGRVDMGAYEYDPLQSTGAIAAVVSADYIQAGAGGTINFTAAVAGRMTGCLWQWDDGGSVSNVMTASHVFGTLGTHTVVFTVWNLDTTNHVEFTIEVVPPATRYASLAGAHTPPFTNWASAATNIQAAIDAAFPGDFVLVGRGVYRNGSAFAAGAENRVALNKTPLTVSSVEGPARTIILAEGGRGAFVGSGALLSGFTITNGFAPLGGGVWCDGSGTVSKCIVTGNQAMNGGGVYGGTLWRCTLSQNTAQASEEVGGGGYGGGAFEGALSNCLVVSNSAYGFWSKESDSGFGGGASGGRLASCTVVGNFAGAIEAGGVGSGVYGSALTNCIVYDNTGTANNVEGGTASFTCMPTITFGGAGNITNAPLFVNAAVGDFRLAAGSPCINAGTNEDWMIGALDLAGQPRIVGGTVDMGAYEFQGGSPPAPFTLTARLDHGLVIQWPSQAGFSYQLQSATSLPAGTWQNEGSAFPGTGGVLTTNLPLGPEPVKFFRLQLTN